MTSAEIKMDRIKDLSCRINKNTKLLEKRTELERKAWEILGEDKPDMKKYYSIMVKIDGLRGDKHGNRIPKKSVGEI
jgi:hypothetical protein